MCLPAAYTGRVADDGNPDAPNFPAIALRLGRRVRALRLARGWSQEELARRATIHRVYLGDLERGVRNPSLRHLVAIAAVLGVTIRELLPPDESADDARPAPPTIIPHDGTPEQ
jgi:transcriptional regulator with XRE-family HTH domain